MDFGILWEADNYRLYLDGILVTLKLLLLSVSVGLVLSIGLAVLRVSKNRMVSGPVWLFTYVIRGTPALLQLYLIYYGLSQFDWIRASFAWSYLQDATFCAWLAFVLNTTAYTTEMLAGAIRTMPHGEIEAAKSVGMGKWLTLRRIVLPSALRRSLPPYSNEVIMMLHTTSLASTVTLLDVTAAADRLYSTYYMPFEPFIAAAAIYLILTFTLVRLFRLAENRWLAYLQPRKA